MRGKKNGALVRMLADVLGVMLVLTGTALAIDGNSTWIGNSTGGGNFTPASEILVSSIEDLT